jgi:HPt (histidine-containing phosphotransfer) domain-containing protein
MKETILQLKELLGEDFTVLVSAFEQDNRQILESIEQLIEQNDAKQVSREIHSVKGASSNLGAIELASLCQKLEAEAKAGDLSNAKQHLKSIRTEFEAAVKMLHQLS